MEEKAGNYQEYSNHFVLSETNLRKIHSVMDEYAAKIGVESNISIYIERENDSFFETRDLDKILSDENTSGKAIKTLSMEIITVPVEGENLSEKERSKAVIGFMKDKDTKIRFMTSHKERDWCFLLIDELDTQVKRIIKEKPASLLKAKALDLVVALMILIILMGGIAWNVTDAQINLQEVLANDLDTKINFLVEQEVQRNNSSVIWLIPGMAMTMLIFFFALEFKPITKLVRVSNTSVFYWGDMVSIYDSYIQKRSRIKWGVMIAFVVSLAATFVGTLLFKQ